jgi:hypothetical protein
MSPDVIHVSADIPQSPAKRPKYHKYHGPVLPVQERPDIRRNQLCPCGSGKKAKKCCLSRLKAMAALPPAVRTQAIVAGVLGHWPAVEPRPAVSEAVQKQFDDLVAREGAKWPAAEDTAQAAPDGLTTVPLTG